MGPARLPDGSGFYVLRLVVSERVDYAGSEPEKPSPNLHDKTSSGQPPGPSRSPWHPKDER
jgi:hypothetical protein